MSNHATEIKSGNRYAFGKNWRSFLLALNEERIIVAENSLKECLRLKSLQEKSFLDIGSGSGLFSLVARRLGAEVYSFDYDPESVACTAELKNRYFFRDDQSWIIKEGSVLDDNYMDSLTQFDIVYSWGVLHHTGEMWKALEKVASKVKQDGFLFIAIYNDQGIKSVIWKNIKKLYCSGALGKGIVLVTAIPYLTFWDIVRCIVKRKNIFKEYKKNRGMSILHDYYDWLGGYPFEVATVDNIFNFYFNKGFILHYIKTSNNLACNEFVFQKKSEI